MASHHGRLQGLGGGFSREEDMVRASSGEPGLQGNTSLGPSVPERESESCCQGT